MKLKLTQQTILEKKFKPNVKGYDPLEVDKFLDLVINDYGVVEEKAKKSEEEVLALKREIESLKATLRESEKNLSIEKSKNVVLERNKVSDHNGLDPIELLQKCSKYEIKLYELGCDPSKVK